MATTTKVPAIEWTPEGLVLPPESAILSGVLDDLDNAFGGGMNRDLETPQGQIASSMTAIVGSKNDDIALFVNQIDPDNASGHMQDAIGRIYFLERHPATQTVVQCTCIGAVGTPIPAGARAQDTSGNIYIAVDGGSIPSTGQLTLAFACVQFGPVSCPANTLNKIYQTIPGWDTVNNPNDGVPGRNIESRADFEYRRRQSVALNAHGTMPSVRASVFNLDGVIDVYGYENYENVPITIGETDYPMKAHSILVSVVGGRKEDIIKAIWSKKGNGCSYNGNTSGIVYDTEGYDQPYPQYTVTYLVPDTVTILFRVQLKSNPNLPSNIDELVKGAIIGAMNGDDGGQRARVAAEMYASRFYAPVSMISQNMAILSIFIGIDEANLNSLRIGVDQFPTTNVDSISVELV